MPESNGSREIAADEAARPTEVAFDYLKSNSYRVIHMSGAHGGPTPNARFIHMAIYNERLPIPQKEVYQLDEAGKLKPGPDKMQPDALIREVEVSVILDVPTAKALVQWLSENIAKIEKIGSERRV